MLHVTKTSKQYFEGWYLKQQCNNHSFAVIPGIAKVSSSDSHAFIQIITLDQSYYIEFPISTFHRVSKRFDIKIGENRFNRKGMIINIHTDDLTIKGKLQFIDPTPLAYPIMGPFSLIPNMECIHEVISMHHIVEGAITINGKTYEYNMNTHAIGYIEADKGTSFPSQYIWTQSCESVATPFSITAAIAEIPLASWLFHGCICCILYKGKQYRLATYLGAHIKNLKKDCVIIEQKNYRLEIRLHKENSNQLMAPSFGKMNRTIHESLNSLVEYNFYVNNQLVFHYISPKSSFEYVF